MNRHHAVIRKPFLQIKFWKLTQTPSILPAVMRARTVLIFLWAFLFYLPAQAEPANVLVGDFTFTRPKDWIWESATGKSKALTRFIFPNNAGKPSTTDVRFYVGQKNAAVAAALWKSYFPEAKDPKEVWEEQKKIGNHDLTYVSVSGTYVPGGNKSKPNYTWFGAIVPSGKDFVHVRILGPKNEVQRASAQFKKMVEDALRDKEGD
ncbi:MAG: hypothetical protein JWM68_2751 [Verrucomicrobiales bacterium]|nr:hypothetical protein [Verrucomicrobiales bacterium]